MSYTPSTQERRLPNCPTTVSNPSVSAPMLSPTSEPQPSKSVPERKAKLRASCDACAASKVKCSKEHPVCARCAVNGSQCIYGVSRKHGKPGRTRKRNPDGSPFIKGSKQRPSPDGSEFGKFRIRAAPEPQVREVSPRETPSWPSTPDWPATPNFDYQMEPEPSYSAVDYSFMDDILMGNIQQNEEPSLLLPSQPELNELTFRDPFPKKRSLQLDLPLPPDFQALKNFIGGDSVNPIEYDLSDPSPMNSYFPIASPAESPRGTNNNNTNDNFVDFSPLRASIAMPTFHCCYSLAYSTLESLQFQTTKASELMSLDSVLCVTKTAVQNVTQLLSCPCASDPHLAMLYSSITTRIITWYQTAAGLRPTSSASSERPSTPALSTISSPSHSSSASTSSSTSTFSSPLPTPNSTSAPPYSIQLQPLKIGQFEFDEADQEALRRQVVLRELKKCGVLVEALATWRREGAEQAEFLYDVLGAWLKSELWKTVREIEGGDE